MARFLITWELGGGLGHLSGLKPIVAELLRRGHHVSLALRYAAKYASYNASQAIQELVGRLESLAIS
jgi:hypothetical protein